MFYIAFFYAWGTYLISTVEVMYKTCLNSNLKALDYLKDLVNNLKKKMLHYRAFPVRRSCMNSYLVGSIISSTDMMKFL